MISAVLLGAGKSKRMGVNKLLLPWRRKTVLEHCVETLLRSKVQEVVIVLSNRNKGIVNLFQGPKVKPHGLKPMAPPHASKGGTLRSIPHCARNELRGVTPLAFIHGLKVRGFLRRRVKVVLNPYSKRGMSTSICRGLGAIHPNSNGILIALGDQPFLKTRTINALIRAFDQGKGGIIIPSFQGRHGHPVIFHRRYKRELWNLKGDVGGKSIIERHPVDIRVVPIKSVGVVKDIDTWQDYKRELRI